jgi:hypothetical protein
MATPKTISHNDDSLINLLYQSGISIQQIESELQLTLSQIRGILINSGWILDSDDNKNSSISPVVNTVGNYLVMSNLPSIPNPPNPPNFPNLLSLPNLSNLQITGISVDEPSQPLLACLRNEVRDIRSHLQPLMRLDVPQINHNTQSKQPSINPRSLMRDHREGADASVAAPSQRVKPHLGRTAASAFQDNQERSCYNQWTSFSSRRSKGEIDNSIESNQSKLELSYILMPMIRPERVNNDISWRNIGKALYSCNNGDANGLNEWIRFTEAGCQLLHDRSGDVIKSNEVDSTIHTVDDCRDLYPLFQEDLLPINTLAIYASQDSPQKYRVWHDRWCNEALDDIPLDGSIGLVRAFYRIYWLDFISTRMRQGKWYRFENQQWIEQKGDTCIRQTITNDLMPRLQQLYDAIAQLISVNPELDNLSRLMNPLKTIRSLIDNLKRYPFKNSFISQAKEFFYYSTVDVKY